MIKKRYISSLFLVASVSLIGTGFSSWIIYSETENIATDVNINVSKIKDIIQGLYYVPDSQYFFDYYLFDGAYHITTSTIGFKLMMYKNLFEANLDKSEDLYMYLMLSYTHTGTTDFDIFSNGNSHIEVPTYVKAKHFKNNKYFINSDEITTSYVSSNSVHTHVMQARILAYSPDKPSLYSLSERYTNDNVNIPYFNIDFDFNIGSTNTISTQTNFEKYLNLSFKFSFNINIGEITA